MKTALIIGGGPAGCAAAHQLALLGGWDVTLVERAAFLGGGVKTHWYGGHPHTFGPRHFLTHNERVFHYLHAIVPLRRLDHEFITYVERDQEFYHFPIHRDDIARMPDRERIERELAQLDGAAQARNLEEFWVQSVGRTLYEKFIDSYSRKMWLIDDNTRIDDFGWSPKGVTIKEGSRTAWDAAISAYPIPPNGYDDWFTVATAQATVRLSTTIEAYDIPRRTVVLDGERRRFDVIVNTIAPDALFDYAYGELPFVGRDIYLIVLPMEHCFPEHVYFIYYANAEKFTRLVEYKKFTQHIAPSTLLGLEVPSMNGKYYPMPFAHEQTRAQRYLDEMPDNVFSIGRAGSYRYKIDIDDCIEQAMEIAARLAA